MASYELAIEQGADYIEPDLVSTKDGILIARHENEISTTTDVEQKFPDRKKTKIIDGTSITGWFTEDFTLKEIKTLRAKERLSFRNHNYDGQFEIPTFSEVLELAQKKSQEKKRVIGVYPETKHPSYFKNLGLPLEKKLVADLKSHGLNKKSSPIFIQSFEFSSLKELSSLTPVPMIYLIETTEQLKDHPFGDIKKIASGVGVAKRLIVPEDELGHLLSPTLFVKDAHKAGLKVHVFTFRSDPSFLAKEYGSDPKKEYRQFFDLGVDGVFSDFPDQAIGSL